THDAKSALVPAATGDVAFASNCFALAVAKNKIVAFEPATGQLPMTMHSTCELSFAKSATVTASYLTVPDSHALGGVGRKAFFLPAGSNQLGEMIIDCEASPAELLGLSELA